MGPVGFSTVGRVQIHNGSETAVSPAANRPPRFARGRARVYTGRGLMLRMCPTTRRKVGISRGCVQGNGQSRTLRRLGAARTLHSFEGEDGGWRGRWGLVSGLVGA